MSMNRRLLLAAGLGGLASACATNPPPPSTGGSDPRYGVAPGEPVPGGRPPPAYTREELVSAGSNALGVAAEAIGGAIERVAREQGQEPTAYIAGEEGSGAIGVGARYGRGLLYMKNGAPPTEVFWQGPSVGWDWGGNAARVFTLAYGLWYPDAIFRRYPGVEGSAYLVGGLGVNYQAADGIVLAPIRAGVGLRLGASVGYLAYSRQRNLLPF
jgi:hypothetical protein